jgi:hypothetical protein
MHAVTGDLAADIAMGWGRESALAKLEQPWLLQHQVEGGPPQTQPACNEQTQRISFRQCQPVLRMRLAPINPQALAFKAWAPWSNDRIVLRNSVSSVANSSGVRSENARLSGSTIFGTAPVVTRRPLAVISIT